MAASAREFTTHSVLAGSGVVPQGEYRITKVYWPDAEKRAFQEEAARHGQRESEFARFILNARADPMLFLQMCRLRDPAFASGLASGPADVGKLAEAEKTALELKHEAENLRRERDEASRRVVDLERQLDVANGRVESMSARVATLALAAEGNRERLMDAGAMHEAAPLGLRVLVKVLSATPRLTRKELEASLVGEGLSDKEAADAVKTARRLELVTIAPGGRFVLAKQPPEDDE